MNADNQRPEKEEGRGKGSDSRSWRDEKRERSRASPKRNWDPRTAEANRKGGGRRGELKPLPRPGHDEDGRMESLKDDPRYFEGAELGKAQLAALGVTGLAGQNTASFSPESTLVRPAMRIFHGVPGEKQFQGRLRWDDVLVVPDFYCNENDTSFYLEFEENLRLMECGRDCDLDALPDVCRRAVDRISEYLQLDSAGCAVRITRESQDKTLVNDFGKFAFIPTKSNNCVAVLSLGHEREMAYRRSGSQELLFFPQSNGALKVVGKEVWARWESGRNEHTQQTSDRDGHISLMVVGLSALMKEDKVLGPVPSDAKIGAASLRGQMGVPVRDRPRPDMRVITVPKRPRFGRPIRHDDVIVVPEFICAEDDWGPYYALLDEMRKSQAHGEADAQWISWHEGAHLLSKNPTGSKTYKKVLDKVAEYFSIAEKNQGTRFNWYVDGSDWKPFHHDSAAFNPHRAKTQNCTIGISFGSNRELGFRHAKTGELIYFPQRNGMLFYFGRDANIVWQHGINALGKDEQDGKGRISIVLWGLCTTATDEEGSPPMLSDDSRGKGKGKGKSKNGGSWGYDGRQNQPCRDFSRGNCSYGDRCRFSHNG